MTWLVSQTGHTTGVWHEGNSLNCLWKYMDETVIQLFRTEVLRVHGRICLCTCCSSRTCSVLPMM